MISFLGFEPPPRNRLIRLSVFTARDSAPVALRPQKLEPPLRAVDSVRPLPVQDNHQLLSG